MKLILQILVITGVFFIAFAALPNSMEILLGTFMFSAAGIIGIGWWFWRWLKTKYQGYIGNE